MHKRQRQSGFTLIEVLVAFAVTALVLGAAMQAFAGGLTRDALLGEYREALSLAESELEKVGRDSPLTTGVVERSEDNGFHLRREVRPYAGMAQVSGVTQPYEVSVSVSWPGPEQPHRIQLVSVRLGGEQ